MERHSPVESAENAGLRAAERLFALRDRAQASLASQRQRSSDLESELRRQLDAIASALDENLANSTERERAQSELDELRSQFDQAQLAFTTERLELEQQLSQRETEIRSQQEALEQQRVELEARETAMQSLRQQCDERQAQCDAREQLLEQQRTEIETTDQVNLTRTVQIDSREIELTLREHQLEQEKQQLNSRSEQLDEQQVALTARQEQLELEQSELHAQTEDLDRRQRELATQQDSSSAEVTELRDKLAAAEQAAQQQQVDLQASFSHLEKGFVEREQFLREDITKLTCERDKLVAALNSTSADLESSQVALKERDALQQKFDLALEDVRRLRERTSELEQELSRRPEAQKGASPEMVHLRGERDSLADRVAELEKQVAAETNLQPTDHDSDIQRRFEMAVEDVRQLKTENAALQQKLVEAATSGGAAQASDGQDWEAQKRRLLAALSAEGDDADEPRRQELASIEDTIHITDEVIAEKDRQISELQAQLGAAGTAAAAEAATAHDQELEKLFSNDEIIQQHRANIAQLEQELQDKLRTTELELSFQRAKIAREQSELAEGRTELEALRRSLQQLGEGATPGAPPKRRWLAKLGLGDEDN